MKYEIGEWVKLASGQMTLIIDRESCDRRINPYEYRCRGCKGWVIGLGIDFPLCPLLLNDEEWLNRMEKIELFAKTPVGKRTYPSQKNAMGYLTSRAYMVKKFKNDNHTIHKSLVDLS
jgi:hypothetical protein